MGELECRLRSLSRSDMYPFHMPGHKRAMEGRPVPEGEELPYDYDITEIDGFDNLHHPEGLLLEMQKRAAALWKARRSFLLVNGSTCGLLAAIGTALPRGGHLLMARNCHKAAYHAAYLSDLRITYLYPAITACGIQGGITPRQVEEALEREPDIGAVLVTSPTYDGVVSDIAGIAKVVHSRDLPLIVDEAHGAHLGFHAAFPQTAVQCGADMVVQSLHKTLPALTQSAVLHLCSEQVDEERLKWLLTVYQTSSPSYVLLVGMERCLDILEGEGDRLFDRYAGRLRTFYERTEKLRLLRVWSRRDLSGEEAFGLDPSKILISAEAAGLSGYDLYQRFRERYRLQPEMCQGSYVLMMTGIMDTDEGMERLWQALWDMDTENVSGQTGESVYSAAGQAAQSRAADYMNLVYGRRTRAMSLSEALEAPCEKIFIDRAAGRISRDFVTLYPPGIPLVAPGEIISEDVLEAAALCRRLQGTVHGISGGQIKVVIS